MSRITISFPDTEKRELKEVLDFHGRDNWSQSRVFVEAFNLFYRHFTKNKLRLQAEKMRGEYLNNPELNVFADIDGEDFHE